MIVPEKRVGMIMKRSCNRLPANNEEWGPENISRFGYGVINFYGYNAIRYGPWSLICAFDEQDMKFLTIRAFGGIFRADIKA